MSKPGTKINGAFVPHLRDMLASPAWRALSLSGHRVLDRLEIEHMRHAGKDNGKLPVTFADLVTHGIGDRNAIAPAIRECVALGFIEVTQRGRSGNGTFRKPNRFRLTYLPTEGAAPTHDWHALKTDNDAAEKVCEARAEPALEKPKRQYGKPDYSRSGNPTTHRSGNPTTRSKNPAKPLVGKPDHYLDIYPSRGPSPKHRTPTKGKAPATNAPPKPKSTPPKRTRRAAMIARD